MNYMHKKNRSSKILFVIHVLLTKIRYVICLYLLCLCRFTDAVYCSDYDENNEIEVRAYFLYIHLAIIFS